MNYIQPLIKSGNYYKGKINPKSIGYVCKNGNINFATEEAALLYAKNRVLKALDEEIPYERGIVIKDKSVIADVEGDKYHVIFKNINVNKATIVHGHPGFNYPISITDIETLVLNRLKKCIAFNNKGEYSMVSILPHSKLYELLLPNLLKEFISIIKFAIFKSLLEELLKKIDIKLNKMRAIIQKDLQAVIDNADNDTKLRFIDWYKKTDNKELRDTTLLPMEYRDDFEKLNQFGEFQLRAIRYFLQKIASKCNLKYETNYTNNKPEKIHSGDSRVIANIIVNESKN